MIQVHKLRKSYDDVIALNDIDLTVRKGAITGLLGPNGAGKTTLVSILTGITDKTSGRVQVNGIDLDSGLDAIRSLSSIVPQTLAFYPNLSVYENLEYFSVLFDVEQNRRKERIDFAIEAATLQQFIKKRAGRMSGGMQRRLNLAIGLLNEPQVLYLDEPTVGVDVQSRRYMLEMIKQINRDHGTTIVYTSHYIAEIEQISDDIVIINNGKIILKDNMEEVFTARDVLTIEADRMPASLKKELKSIKGTGIEGRSIIIEKDDRLIQTTSRVLSVLKKNSRTMENMVFNRNRLEELYLELTSNDIKDTE